MISGQHHVLGEPATRGYREELIVTHFKSEPLRVTFGYPCTRLMLLLQTLRSLFYVIIRDLPHIQLQDVSRSHLISYDTERDLLPLILAQCNYSLEVGRGTLVQYNWEALERQLIDRFIRGRPLIDFKV